jgi:hypothetical protein
MKDEALNIHRRLVRALTRLKADVFQGYVVTERELGEALFLAERLGSHLQSEKVQS